MLDSFIHYFGVIRINGTVRMTEAMFQRNSSAISPISLHFTLVSGDGCSEIEAKIIYRF